MGISTINNGCKIKKLNSFKPTTSIGKSFNGRQAIDDMYRDPDWKDFSKRFLQVNGRCYSCGHKSEVTDHLVAHKGSEKLFTQNDNVIPLCAKCHNTVTALYDRKPVQKYEDKLKWLAKSRERNDLNFKVKVIPYVIR